jgi:hypothetical protein
MDDFITISLPPDIKRRLDELKKHYPEIPQDNFPFVVFYYGLHLREVHDKAEKYRQNYKSQMHSALKTVPKSCHAKKDATNPAPMGEAVNG